MYESNFPIVRNTPFKTHICTKYLCVIDSIIVDFFSLAICFTRSQFLSLNLSLPLSPFARPGSKRSATIPRDGFKFLCLNMPLSWNDRLLVTGMSNFRVFLGRWITYDPPKNENSGGKNLEDLSLEWKLIGQIMSTVCKFVNFV